MLDVLIRGGRIVDGTGTPWFRGDVAVQGGRVVGLGVLAAESATRVIEADDLYVCPGFVDMHAHSDLQLLEHPTWEVKLAQGVTLDVLGQDGLGLAPITAEAGSTLRHQLGGWNGDPRDIAFDWRSVAEYLGRFDQHVATNVAVLAPHGTIRLDVMGSVNRAPTGEELHAMRELVDGAMRDGAVGLSAGLTYAPAMYADDDELVALCEVIRAYGGYYGPHHRSYGATALEAYRASIDIARRARVPLHLTHALMNYPVNRGRAPELLRLVDEARAEGIEVTLDSYPYLAGNTYLHAYLPSWVHEGGSEAVLRRLDDPDTRARIRHEMEEVGSDGFQGVSVDWSTIVIASVSRPEHRHLVGLSIPDAAAREGAANAFDFFCDLLLADDLGVGSLAFSGTEENVRTVMQHPAHMAGSDGIVIGDRPHPRAWGTFARYLAYYVRELGLVRLEDMVRKMTSSPMARLGFFDRGVVRPGAWADLVVFDADLVRDTATYERPRSAPEGIPYVLVNGQLVIDGGSHTGALPGRALRRVGSR
ncbi:MAG: D-aminoacylase [Chloroflexi bacterium]|nr:D-aminoacylase [Chloroflexota bacterium]